MPVQVRQANTFFPHDEHHDHLRRRIAAETNAFIKARRRRVTAACTSACTALRNASRNATCAATCAAA